MKKKECKNVHHHGGGAVYGLGFIGGIVYFLQQATTIREGILGLLKSLVWPAVLVYKLLEFLNI